MKFKQLNWLLVLILMLSLPALACESLSFGGGDEENTSTSDDEEEPAEDEEEEAEDEEADTESGDEEESADEDEEAAEPEIEEQPVETAEEESSEEVVEDESSEETAEEETAEGSAAPAAFGSTVNISELSAQDDTLFEDYRFVMDFSFIGTDASGAEVSQSMIMDAVFTNEPQAFSMNMTMEGVEDMEEFGSISMAQIGSNTYMTLPEMGCISSSGEDFIDNPLADLTDTDQFLDDVGDADFVGEEEINGRNTLHYTFDESALAGEDMEGITMLSGDVYIDEELGFIVRFVMDGEGQLTEFTDGFGADDAGFFRIQFDLLDINSGQVVTVPAGCEEGAEGAPGAYPMLDDASEVTSFTGVLIYSTATPFDDILTFYNDELTAAGWTYSEDESFVLEGSTAIIVYTQDNGAVLNLTVSEDSENAGSFLVSVFDASE